MCRGCWRGQSCPAQTPEGATRCRPRRRPKRAAKAKTAKAAKKPASKKTAKPAAKTARRRRGGAKDNKTTALIAMLTKGATAEHMARTLGWLPHTLRAALSRLKTKEGLKIARERVDGTTSYRFT